MKMQRFIVVSILSICALAAQAQETAVPYTIEWLRENAPALAESCLDPALGPIEVEIDQVSFFLIGCDENASHMLLSPVEEFSSLTSFQFVLHNNRYWDLVPLPIDSLAYYSIFSELSDRQLVRLSRRLRRSSASASRP
jgi:hypothetical protein